MPVSGGHAVLLSQFCVERVPLAEAPEVLDEPIADDEPGRPIAHESALSKTALQSLQRRSSPSLPSETPLTRGRHLRSD